MGKKRKVRSSEPESTEIEQEQPQIEEEQAQIEQIDELQTNEEEEEQVIEDEEQPQQEIEDEEQPQQMEEDENDNDDEEKEDEETEGIGPVNGSNGVGAAEQPPPEANGGDTSGGLEEEEEEDLELEEEPVEKLIEPFSKDQLVVLLREAVSKYPELVESVHKLADADPVQRKIFVHGLGWDATSETLIGVFSKYGEIEDCNLVCDKVTGKPKGYGFILFKQRIGARKALKQPQKQIGSRMTSCQLASAGPVPAAAAAPPTAPQVSEYTQRKIFVSNVSADLEPQKLVEYFSKFGEIEEGPLGLDKQTGKPRGFVLFVYKSVESAKKALEEPHKNFEGHMLNCQKAIDGPKGNKPFFQKPQYQPTIGASGSGHMMAPSAPALAPALGQALTALLATQGGGLGIANLLGGLGAPGNQGVPPVMNNAGYGNQGGGYGNQPAMRGGYRAPHMGRGGGRGRRGGGPYRGRGH